MGTKTVAVLTAVMGTLWCWLRAPAARAKVMDRPHAAMVRAMANVARIWARTRVRVILSTYTWILKGSI